MNLMERIASWLGLIPRPQPGHVISPLEETLAQGLRHKWAERYDLALEAFDRSLVLIDPENRPQAQAIIALQKAAIWISQGRASDAENLLAGLPEADGGQRADRLTLLGKVAQERGDWSAAQSYYEQARQVAEESESTQAAGRALGHLADVYLRDGNTTYALHLLREALANLDMSGDQESLCYFAGRLGETLIENGQKSEGYDLITRALRLAEDMEHGTYQRLWRLVMANDFMLSGMYKEARRNYKLALAFFHQSTSSPEYITLLCHLSKTSLRLFEYDDAVNYARRAVEAGTSLGKDHPVCSLARAALGVALRTAGHYAEAIPYLRSTDSIETLNIKHALSYSRVDVLRNLATALSETGEVHQAFAIYQQALQEAQAAKAALEIAGTYRDLGVLYARTAQPHEAIKNWTSALELYEQEHEYARVARLYCDIANVRRQIGQGRRAAKDYENSLTALNMTDDQETRGIVLANAATAYIDHGDIETAESFFIESIKIAQRTGDQRAEATRRGNYGWFLLSTGRAQRALNTLSHALRQSQEMGLTLAVAVQTDNTGLAYDELGSYDTAAEHHRRALTLIGTMNEPQWEATFRANLGHSLLMLDALDEAEDQLREALEIAQRQEAVEASVRAQTGLARLALKRGQINPGLVIAIEAVDVARRAGLQRVLAGALTVLSELFAAAGMAEKAVDAWDEAVKLLQALRIPAAAQNPAWLSNLESGT